MYYFFYILVHTLTLFLSVLQGMILIRVLISIFWGEEGGIMQYLTFVTEFAVMPFRALLERSEVIPAEFSMLAAVVVLSLAESFLSALI